MSLIITGRLSSFRGMGEAGQLHDIIFPARAFSRIYFLAQFDGRLQILDGSKFHRHHHQGVSPRAVAGIRIGRWQKPGFSVKCDERSSIKGWRPLLGFDFPETEQNGMRRSPVPQPNSITDYI
jgi:hypothetical protein